MPDLTHEQLAYLGRVLDDRAQTLRDELQQETRDKESFTDVASELADPGDASFADLTLDLGNASMTRDLIELRAIEAARQRMDDGSYGECVECGTDIPYERLEVQPAAERCTPCQGMYEKTHLDAGRGATL